MHDDGRKRRWWADIELWVMLMAIAAMLVAGSLAWVLIHP